MKKDDGDSRSVFSFYVIHLLEFDKKTYLMLLNEIGRMNLIIVL